MQEKKEIPKEIQELIEKLNEKKYEFILLGKNKKITITKSVLCDRIIKLLEGVYE